MLVIIGFSRSEGWQAVGPGARIQTILAGAVVVHGALPAGARKPGQDIGRSDALCVLANSCTAGECTRRG